MIKSKWRTTFLIAPTVLHVWLMSFLGLAAQAIVFLRLRRLGKRGHDSMAETAKKRRDMQSRTRRSASLPPPKWLDSARWKLALDVFRGVNLLIREPLMKG